MTQPGKRSFKLNSNRRAALDALLQKQGVDTTAPADASPAPEPEPVAMPLVPAPPVPARTQAATPRTDGQFMDFGLMFFASVDQPTERNKYKMVIEAARFADTHGFCAIWTPERHFHGFGGLFPNPSVTNAALSMVTERVQLRAGSVISPLHHTIRIAEEWSVVDNLSGGRVGVSFGAGWNADDFLFFPERFQKRHATMYEQIETVCKLWHGEAVTYTNTFGKELNVKIYPQPLQPDLPIWITASNSVENFIQAGSLGLNILTHLIGQDLQTLAGKIARYRESLREHGYDEHHGKVSLMLHTFVGPDHSIIKEAVRKPFREYLRSAISLEEKAAIGGGTISGGHKIDPHTMPDDVKEDLLDLTFERYFSTAALMGTPETCTPIVQKLCEIGVDEIACLLDFGLEDAVVMNGLEYLNLLRANWQAPADA
jgi:natural product biosynthesis luciferase-like monooxygenase protein